MSHNNYELLIISVENPFTKQGFLINHVGVSGKWIFQYITWKIHLPNVEISIFSKQGFLINHVSVSGKWVFLY